MKTTINDFYQKKNKEKITLLTCYDYSTAKILNQTDIDSILIGDSLGMVFQGNDSTLSVTVDEMIYHTKAVRKGAPDKFLIVDMPFLSYHVSAEDAVRNAGKIIKETNAEAVKLEGGEEVADKIKALIAAKIPVMGHLGLTPQSINLFGGHKVQGNTVEKIQRLIDDAVLLEKIGVFSIVLESIPEKIAEIITKKINIPTIGIGAGRYVDGQVLVINDVIGLGHDVQSRFIKRYSDVSQTIKNSADNYIADIKKGIFPTEENVYKISKEILDQFKEV